MYGPGLLGDATQDAITALSQQISDLNNQLAMETPGTPSFVSIQTQLTVLNTQRAQLQGQATTNDTPSNLMSNLANLPALLEGYVTKYGKYVLIFGGVIVGLNAFGIFRRAASSAFRKNPRRRRHG